MISSSQRIHQRYIRCFNAAFKTNSYLERAIMIGIIRVQYRRYAKFAEQTSNGSALVEPVFLSE